MQTAHSEEWRPGFVKRADNFEAVCSQAEAWRWRPGETVPRVAAAVLKGTPTLTAPQRLTLMLYVEHLNQERLEQDIACVWPSTTLIAEYLGCSASSARSNRRALEAAGFMVRDYNHANRPAGLEAYDLRPLMARLGEMEGFDEAVREAAAARRAAYSEALVFPTRHSAQAPESRRLEQSQKNLSYSVTAKDADTPRVSSEEPPATRSDSVNGATSSTKRDRRRTGGAIGSSERAGIFGTAQSSTSAHAEMVRQEVQTAVRVCPRLAPLIGEHLLQNPAAATLEDGARIVAAGPLLLPEAERNNGLSVEWGWNRHGIRVIAMLAIALEDGAVRNPCKYFGWMATRDPSGAPDLRVNLRRLLKERGDGPPAELPGLPEAEPGPVGEPPPELMFAPGAEDPPWPEINTELRRLIREGAYGSWFSRVGFHGLTDGVLILSTPTGLAADRIKRDYVRAILQAAENVGVFVERVSLTVRKR